MALSLAELRAEEGVSLEYLAEATGVKIKTLERMERGELEKVYAKDVVLISRHFGTTKIKGITVFD